jgi:hypothetical protein
VLDSCTVTFYVIKSFLRVLINKCSLANNAACHLKWLFSVEKEKFLRRTRSYSNEEIAHFCDLLQKKSENIFL